jgi:hypothetical protein
VELWVGMVSSHEKEVSAATSKMQGSLTAAQSAPSVEMTLVVEMTFCAKPGYAAIHAYALTFGRGVTSSTWILLKVSSPFLVQFFNDSDFSNIKS